LSEMCYILYLSEMCYILYLSEMCYILYLGNGIWDYGFPTFKFRGKNK
jgi:hypothetical protein